MGGQLAFSSRCIPFGVTGERGESEGRNGFRLGQLCGSSSSRSSAANSARRLFSLDDGKRRSSREGPRRRDRGRSGTWTESDKRAGGIDPPLDGSDVCSKPHYRADSERDAELRSI